MRLAECMKSRKDHCNCDSGGRLAHVAALAWLASHVQTISAAHLTGDRHSWPSTSSFGSPPRPLSNIYATASTTVQANRPRYILCSATDREARSSITDASVDDPSELRHFLAINQEYRTSDTLRGWTLHMMPANTSLLATYRSVHRGRGGGKSSDNGCPVLHLARPGLSKR